MEKDPDDLYDLIFVVMKYNDFPSVLSVLAENQSTHIVRFVREVEKPSPCRDSPLGRFGEPNEGQVHEAVEENKTNRKEVLYNLPFTIFY